MDELKKYLQDNRHKLDVDEPAAGLLQRLQKQTAITPKNKPYTILVRMAVAASIIGAIFLSVQLLRQRANRSVQPDISATTPPIQIKKLPANINPDTLQHLVHTPGKPNMDQQKKEAVIKQIPVAYQLLNSFEQHYNKLVNLQLKNIRNTPVYGETPDYFNGFKNRMHQIYEDELVLKQNIKINGLTDELLEQLINVYQEKIKVLKNLQQEITGMNNKIKENKQPADSISIYYINI